MSVDWGEKHENIPWLQIRADYLTGAYTLPQLGERYEIPWTDIRTKMSRDRANGMPWVTRAGIEEAALSTLTRAVADVAMEQAAEQLAQNVTKHIEIEAAMLDLAHQTLLKAKEGRLTFARTSGEAETVRAVMEAASAAVRASREIRGMRQGESSIPVTEEDARIEQAVLVVKEKPSEANRT